MIGALVYGAIYFFSDQAVLATFREETDMQTIHEAVSSVDGQSSAVRYDSVSGVGPITVEIRVVRWKWLLNGGEAKLRAHGEIQSLVGE